MRSERAIRRCVRCAAESRCAAAARSGIIGLTIRDSSCCHWMAVGIRRMRGRLSAARSCVCNAAKCVRLRRRGCDGFVLFTHSAWVWRASPVAIRWLGGDLRSGQRREYHPNMPAPALRREWPPLEASHRPRQCNGTFGGLCVKVRKVAAVSLLRCPLSQRSQLLPECVRLRRSTVPWAPPVAKVLRTSADVLFPESAGSGPKTPESAGSGPKTPE